MCFKLTIMKKFLFIGLLMFSNNLIAQSKNNFIRIKPSERIPIVTVKSDSLIKRNWDIIDSLKSKTIIESNKKTNNPYGSKFWYIIDPITNKIIDTLLLFNFIKN